MGKTFILRIDNMAFGGDGVGTISASVDGSAAGSDVEGIRCFVPFSSPGDLLRVEIVEQKKRFLRGRIVEIDEGSSRRSLPECPLFGICGGCTLQHMEYTAQIEAKRNILVQNLHRLGGLAMEDGKEDGRRGDLGGKTISGSLEERVETAASPREYGYRRRVRMRISPEGRPAFSAVPKEYRADTGAAVGTPIPSSLHRDSHRALLVEIPHCPVADSQVNHIIRSAYSGEMSLPAGSTLLIQNVDGKVEWEVEGTSGKEIGFFQVNEEVNGLLIEQILQEAQASHAILEAKAGGGEDSGGAGLYSLRVLDLFCGNGNLSLSMAAAGARVAGYDKNEGSLEKAQKASTTMQGASYKKMDVKKAVRAIVHGNIRPFGKEKPNFILLDPPRSGMGEEDMGALLRIGADTILYVSCDPATLSRDLKKSTQEGYLLERAVVFDMFPQTSHFETLAVLKKIR